MPGPPVSVHATEGVRHAIKRRRHNPAFQMTDDFHLTVVDVRSTRRDDRTLTQHRLGQHVTETFTKACRVHETIERRIHVRERSVLVCEWQLVDQALHVPRQPLDMAAQGVWQSDEQESSLRGPTREGCERLEENRMPVGRIRLTDTPAHEIVFADSETGSKLEPPILIDTPE